jgi:hypothetical protein
MIKITESTGSEKRTTAKIDLGLTGLPQSLKKKIQDDVGEFLVEQVLLSVGEAKSPVSGESFRALSKEYKQKKIDLGGTGAPNMELNGDMLDSLTYKKTGNGIELGFFDEQAWKADGHLKFSGEENNTPKRRFLPAQGQKFKSAIEIEIERIIQERVDEWEK